MRVEEECGSKRAALTRAGDEDGQTAENACFEGTWHAIIYDVLCQLLFIQNKQNDVLLNK